MPMAYNLVVMELQAWCRLPSGRKHRGGDEHRSTRRRQFSASLEPLPRLLQYRGSRVSCVPTGTYVPSGYGSSGVGKPPPGLGAHTRVFRALSGRAPVGVLQAGQGSDGWTRHLRAYSGGPGRRPPLDKVLLLCVCCVLQET